MTLNVRAEQPDADGTDWEEVFSSIGRPSGYVRLGKRGQLVIPAETRKFLGLCAGDTLHTSIDKEGRLVLKKVPTDPIERLREAFDGAYDGIDATAFVRALREEWDD